MVEAELAQPVQPLVAGGRGEDRGRAGRLGQLDRGQPDAARTGLHEHRLARPEVPELEEAVVGRTELDRDAGGLVDREPVGDRVHRRRRHRRQLGVAAEAHRRHDRLADGERRDVGTDLADPARGLVPHHVRRRRHRAAGAVQQVAALDPDGLDLEDDPARAQGGVGHVDVPEDVGPAGPVEGRGFHRRHRSRGGNLHYRRRDNARGRHVDCTP